jgi:uncharacterized protein (DUF4213/DUF364 family)
MADILTTHEIHPSKIDILDTNEKIEMIDEIGELSNMITSVKRTEDKIEMIEKKIDVTGKSVKILSDNFNKLLDMISPEDQDQELSKELEGYLYG